MWSCTNCSLLNYSNKLRCVACFEPILQDQERNDYTYDTIIIGGGIAGSTAAAALGKERIECCLIEGTHRLGGRAKSENWGDIENPFYVDLGAQWMYGANKKKHILIDYGHEYNINVFGDILSKTDIQNSKPMEKYQESNEWIVYDIQTDKCYSSKLYSKITDGIIDYLEDEILDDEFVDKMKKNKKKYSNTDYCINDIFMNTYNQFMVQNIDQNLKKLKDINDINGDFDKLFMQRCMDWSLAWFEDYESLLVDESYYHWFDEDGNDDHEDEIDLNGKYGLFIERIIEKAIDPMYTDIHLNTVCKSVRYNKCDVYNMEIIAMDQTNGTQKTYHCKHVILALSVGCLQQRLIAIPQLAQSIWNTIDNGWGMYKSHKILIQFDRDFTVNNHIKRLTILSTQIEYSLDECKRDNNNIHIPGMYQKYNMCSRHNNKDCNIWIMFLTPRYSQRLNELEMSDEEMDKIILNDVLNIFAKVFGGLPELKKYTMSHWDTNKFYNGSWPYFKQNGGGLDACNIIQNTDNLNLFNEPMKGYHHHLVFAGDWTQSGSGVCQDAYRSGKRAALQIINGHLY